MENICKYCSKIILNKNVGGHVGNCSLNPNRKSQKHEVFKYDLKCIKCSTNYIVELSENKFKAGKYSKYCTKKCCNTHIITDTIKEKIRNAHFLNKSCKVYFINCKKCNKLHACKKKTQIFCTRLCNTLYNREFNISCSLAGLASVAAQSETRRSKNEIAFADLCIKHFKSVECNKPLFNGWDADVIIHDLKIAVLWNGIWHYKQIRKKHSVKQVQARDTYKLKQIADCNYKSYVIKDIGKFDLNKVNDEFNKFLDYIKTI